MKVAQSLSVVPPANWSSAAMGTRPLMIATLLGASVGVPYVMSQSSSGPRSPGAPLTAAPVFGGGQAGMAPNLASNPFVVANTPSPSVAGPAPVDGARFHNLAEVLRFDVSKEWVYGNWPRKSTGLADPELFGIRVPLVTGTNLTDLAGSLTYSFNRQGQVQHISFLGRTADTTPLVQFLTTSYQLERRDAPAGEQLYQVGSGDRVQSELRTRPESVLWATSPHGSFVVELELERPGSDRYLPPRVPKLNIPPAPPPPVAAGGNAGTTSAAESADQPSFLQKLRHATYDNVRHATPEEDNQVQWKRWPN
jgi:hypothetical protein